MTTQLSVDSAELRGSPGRRSCSSWPPSGQSRDFVHLWAFPGLSFYSPQCNEFYRISPGEVSRNGFQPPRQVHGQVTGPKWIGHWNIGTTSPNERDTNPHEHLRFSESVVLCLSSLWRLGVMPLPTLRPSRTSGQRALAEPRLPFIGKEPSFYREGNGGRPREEQGLGFCGLELGGASLQVKPNSQQPLGHHSFITSCTLRSVPFREPGFVGGTRGGALVEP